MPDEDTPTQPATPDAKAGRLPCPECGGTFSDCTWCEGTGIVDRETFARHHATRQGRPPSR